MRPTSTILLCFLLVAFCACKKSTDYFFGKWQILKVVEHDVTMALDDNWIALKGDGTFESYDGALKKKELGNWTYDHRSKKLSIDGTGKANDSEWTLTMKQDTLFFHATSSKVYLIAKKIE